MAYSIVQEGIYYNIIRAGVLEVTYGDAAYSGFVNIPDSVRANGKMYAVEAIGDRAFNACTGLSSLRIPQAVKSIGQSAFAACTSLHSISLPASLETIGDAAFYGCTSLISMSLPAGVSSIGRDAFVRCLMLERFSVAEDNRWFATQDNVLYNKQLTRLIAYPNARSDSSVAVTASQAIAKGISADGGLFVPTEIPKLSLDDIKRIGSLDYIGRAKEILKLYLTDFTEDELTMCVQGAYKAGKFSMGYRRG